jgi:anti-sigma-K factor RskA
MSDDVHRDVAGYILGALDADDREAFELHLVSCDKCRADLIDLAPVPGLLARVDAAEFDHPVELDAKPLIEAARHDLAGIERSRRRWQVSASGLAAAAAVLAIVVVFGIGDQPAIDQGDTVEFVMASDASIDGRVAVADREWGTRVEIDLLGLPIGQEYEIWAVGSDGSWDLAASFAPTKAGTCRVVGATSLRPGEIARVVVTTSDRADELVSAWEE